MTIATRTLIVAVLATTGFSTVGQTAQADTFSQIDRMAMGVRRDSSLLYWEFRRNFGHSAHSRQLLSDASKMYHLADEIHDLAQAGAPGHMAAKLAKLDHTFRHLQGLVDDVENGPSHGDTSRVRSLLHDIKETLRQLHDTIEQTRRSVYRYNGYSQRQRVYPVPAPSHGPGITVGNGNFKFKIGF